MATHPEDGIHSLSNDRKNGFNQILIFWYRCA